MTATRGRSSSPKPEPALLQSLRLWAEGVERVERTNSRRAEDRCFLIRAMVAGSMFPNETWYAWATWVLEARGLPGAEDCGDREVRIIGHPRIQRDTPEVRFRRVAERHAFNTPEHWAGRLASSVESGHFEIEVEKFIREVHLMEVADDATSGRKSREGGGKGGRTAKLKRAGTTAGDRVADWRKELATRKDGRGGPVAEAAWVKKNCASARSLKPETIRRYLQRKD